MSQNSKIEWTDATWNPIRARLKADTPAPTKAEPLRVLPAGTWGYHCEHVSPGCCNCYACRMNKRTLPAWGTGLDYNVPNREKVKIFLDEDELVKPLHWKKPRKIFPCSMTDAFASFVPDEFLDRMFAVAALTPQHDYLFLTKRAERMQEYFTGEESPYFFACTRIETQGRNLASIRGMDQPPPMEWPLPNVWLGVSVEDQARKFRINHLRQTPAAVRFLSLEPLLEDLGLLDLSGIDWVIVGGESGHGARPMEIDWARSIIQQCKAAGVACFVKQLGTHPITRSRCDDNWPTGARFQIASMLEPQVFPRQIVTLHDPKGGDPEEWPRDLRVREYPRNHSQTDSTMLDPTSVTPKTEQVKQPSSVSVLPGGLK